MASFNKERSSFISRRTALKQVGTAAVASVLLPPFTAHAQTRYHNLVFILTDDHRWDAMSCAGDRYVKTPHMDRLAAEGIRFPNAFVTTSLCSPSRASFLTGKYAHTHGKWDNINTGLSRAHKTFPHYLQDAGYKTGFFGKWHMDQDDMPKPGFDQWISFRGQGRYENPVLNINRKRIKAEGYNTDLLTKYAINWIKNVSREPNPFCLYLSYKAVHSPFTPPRRYKNTYADIAVVPPKTFDEDISDKPGCIQDLIEKWKLRIGDSMERWKKFTPKYYGALAAVDDNVGRLLQALEELDLLNKTTVVYAGDNGYLFGEHGGLDDKRFAYEESIKIPFIVRSPEIFRPGSINEEMVLNIDLAPTFLDLAGLPIPEDMQGLTFTSLLKGESGGWRKSFLYEYHRERPDAVSRPTMYGVRTKEWKYISYTEFGQEELYNLVNDPIEDHNLAQNPEYKGTLEEMRKELARLQKETGARKWDTY